MKAAFWYNKKLEGRPNETSQIHIIVSIDQYQKIMLGHKLTKKKIKIKDTKDN